MISLAKQWLADYDAGKPRTIFSEVDLNVWRVEDAYAFQEAVRRLREERGDGWIGYKIGCIHPGLQAQFGLSQPVHANLWESERRPSGCALERNQFLNLAIEGEFAVTFGKDLSLAEPSTGEIVAALDRVFPVIELHHYFFSRGKPSRQELIASNALHAGVVAASQSAGIPPARFFAEPHSLSVEINTALVETTRTDSTPLSPMNSLQWLIRELARNQISITAGTMILTGAMGRLIPITEPGRVRVFTDKEMVEALITVACEEKGS